MSSDITTNNNSNTNVPIGNIVFYVILLTVYSILSYFVGKDQKYYISTTKLNLYFISFFLILIIFKFIFNLNITSGICGNVQWKTALIATLLPVFSIFLPIRILLKIFPGWLSPFSNTFGYGIAKLAGLSKITNQIFLDNTKVVAKEQDEVVIQEALANIYSNKSLLLNEITIENFNNFWERMKKLFKNGVYTNNVLKSSLWNLVWLKTIVSKYIWYALTGILVIIIGFNYITNVGCNNTSKEMLKRHKEYEKNMKIETEEKKKEKKRIYYTED